MFLFTGLPRSGTAWLSNFLTTGGFTCYHEALPTYNTVREYVEDVHDTYMQGNSDSGALFFVDEIKRFCPRIEIIKIINDPVRVNRSLEKQGLLTLSEEHVEIYESLRADYYIEFPKFITNKDSAASLLDYLGMNFDEERWELLKDLNIQTKREVMEAKAANWIKNNVVS